MKLVALTAAGVLLAASGVALASKPIPGPGPSNASSLQTFTYQSFFSAHQARALARMARSQSQAQAGAFRAGARRYVRGNAAYRRDMRSIAADCGVQKAAYFAILRRENRLFSAAAAALRNGRTTRGRARYRQGARLSVSGAKSPRGPWQTCLRESFDRSTDGEGGVRE